MNRNGLASLIIIAAALGFSACGGAAEKAGGDGTTAAATPGANASSPSPSAQAAADATGANAAPANAAATPQVAAAATQQGASQTSAPRGAGKAQAGKMPTPQIGSGGNDLFLFTQARAAVNGDADLKTANVVIEVKEGIVTLGGTVASAALKSKAEQLARGAGAKDVRNQLRVSAGR